MLLIALCNRRSVVLKIAAAADTTGLTWQPSQTSSVSFGERIKAGQPYVAVLTTENLDDAALFARIRADSPQTFIVVCQTTNAGIDKPLWAVLDRLDFDVLCTLDELTDCLLALKAGRFYQSVLLRAHSGHTASESLDGWHDLTPAERRVLGEMTDNKTGPQIADTLCISEKTVNNHKAKISQKLNVRGGPGSLTRFVLTQREQIRKLIG